MSAAARDAADRPPAALSRERPSGRAATAILAATEQLLAHRPLSRVSVADIIAEAGISRTTFYQHFPSKTAVIAEALRRVVDEVTVAVRPARTPATGGDPEAAIRLSLGRWVEVCRTHGALLRAASEEWPHDPALRELWFSMLETMTAGTTRMIQSARRSGSAPAGPDARALAACLMWGFERVLHVSLVGADPALTRPGALVEPLTQMMLGGVYGMTPAAA